MAPHIRYTVRRPIAADARLDREGLVVSRHRSLAAAQRALGGQRDGAAAQGGYSQDYIWDERAHERVSV